MLANLLLFVLVLVAPGISEKLKDPNTTQATTTQGSTTERILNGPVMQENITQWPSYQNDSINISQQDSNMLNNSNESSYVQGNFTQEPTQDITTPGPMAQPQTYPMPPYSMPQQGGGHYSGLMHMANNYKYVKYETNLLSDIVGNYSKGMRPVKSSQDPATIDFDLRLKQLIKLDMKEQILVLEAFVLMRWVDPQVQWNSSAYNGTNIVNIPSTDIWTPDIVLYNNAKDSYNALFTAPVIADSQGNMVWTNAVTLYGSCDIDITWFPMDVQKCPLTFGSWSYSASRLKISFYKQPTGQVDMREGTMFVTNGVWKFKNIASVTSAMKYSCCPEPFSQIEYTFELQRQPKFFLLYLILPCVAIIVLSLLSFIIPPAVGERISFGVTVLLSFSVYLIVISDKLPEKSDRSPLLGILYVLLFYILIFSFVLSTINARLYFNTGRPPRWLLSFALGWDGKLFCRFKRKVRRIQVQSFNDTEMKPRHGNEESFESDEDGGEFEDHRKSKKSEEELYIEQWQAISAYLDGLFFKIIIVFLSVTPLIVVKMLQRQSSNY